MHGAGGIDLGSFELKQRELPNLDDWHPFAADMSKPFLPKTAAPSTQAPPGPRTLPPPAATESEITIAPTDPFVRDLGIISKYNVMLLVDQSGSMATDDCGGISRWKWCEEEARNFCTNTAAALPNGVDLTLFSTNYRDIGAIHAQDLQRVFYNNYPHGGTELRAPLNHLVERFAFGRRAGEAKPMLIAVITDGEPSDFDDVEELLVAISKTIPENMVKIVFLKVGEAVRGGEFIHELDTNLVARGAAYDVVDSEDFGYLRAHGLLRTLCDSVTK
jgi:hypothetical protein